MYTLLMRYRINSVSNSLDQTVQAVYAYVFGRDDLLEFGQCKLILVFGQIFSENFFQVLEVFGRELRPIAEKIQMKRGQFIIACQFRIPLFTVCYKIKLL